MRTTIAMFFLMSTGCGVWSQPDLALDTIVITPKSSFSEGEFHISGRTIERMLLPDVGSIVQRIPGYQVKNYGDVGGLKLASFRSLGANHTSIVVDGQAASVAQSGSTDLSNLPTEFVRSIEVLGYRLRTDIPIAAKLNGSALLIHTLHSPLSLQQHASVHLSLQQGSFGLWSSELGIVVPLKKWRLALSGKARVYSGEFPYTYQNGNQLMQTKRRNNALADQYGTLSINRSWNKKHHIHFLVALEQARKQIPGAVIFYNETANTHLNTQQIRGQAWHHFTGKSNTWTTQINAFQQVLNYIDSNYLNAQGYLKQHYPSREWNGESQFMQRFKYGIQALIGTSLKYEQLEKSTLNHQPDRLVNQNQLQVQKQLFGARLNMQFNQGFTAVHHRQDLNSRTTHYYLPQALISWNFAKQQQLIASAKRTLRLPTFSEMYFQSMIPLNLRPEVADQVGLKWLGDLHKKSWHFEWSLEPFLTIARDKIVAIPTQNTFIWSIVNISKSRNTGIESYFKMQLASKNKRLTYQLSGNYTFQNCLDISDENANNYRHQISYSPQHSGNLDLHVHYQTWSFFTSGMFVGARYALPENIESNRLDAMFQWDAGLTKSFPMKRQLLKISAVVRNLTNQNNQYIRYFVLPGIHYQVKISYEIFPVRARRTTSSVL